MTKTEKKRQELEEWAKKNGWTKDSYGHWHKQDDEIKYRLKMQDTSVRFERKADVRGWFKLSSNHYVNIWIRSDGVLVGLVASINRISGIIDLTRPDTGFDMTRVTEVAEGSRENEMTRKLSSGEFQARGLARSRYHDRLFSQGKERPTNEQFDEGWDAAREYYTRSDEV